MDETLFPAILAYEGEAASYGLSLLHEIGIWDVDAWCSAYTASDQAYLLHFYRTGEKLGFRSFWRNEAPLVRPKPVPSFTSLRHANLKTTPQLYPHSVSEDRLAAQGQALAAFLQPPATAAIN